MNAWLKNSIRRGTLAAGAETWVRVAPQRHRLAIEQISAALPHLDPVSTSEAMFRHLAAIPVELLSALGSHASVEKDRVIYSGGTLVDVVGADVMRHSIAAGRGALLLCAHLGNFELALHAEAARGVPLHVVTKRVKPPHLDRAWRALRRRSGMAIIEDYGSLTAVIRAVRRGGVVAMTLDQHCPPEHAVSVPFFGRDAWTHRGLALLSRRLTCPVIPVFTRRRAHGFHEIVYREPIEFPAQGSTEDTVRKATAAYTVAIERAIRQTPEQWTWLHRRWKTQGR